MSTDHNVDQPLFQILQRIFDLGGGPEPAQKINAYRKILHALHKCLIMLLGEDRCRNQIGNLLAVLDSFEGSPEGNLRLAVADISADQAVHDLPALHIPLGVLDRRKLILRLLEREEFLELLLPLRIFAVDETVRIFAGSIEVDQLPGNIFDRAFDFGPGLLPILTVQPVKLGSLALRARILLQHIELGGQNIQISVPILQLDIILEDVVDLDLLNSLINAEAPVLVNDIVSDMELGKARDFFTGVSGPLLFLFLAGSENISL